MSKANAKQPHYSTADMLTARQAARYLRCSPRTLQISRRTGLLFGRSCPRYIKLGRRVYYRRQTLDRFLDQFQERSHTSACKEMAQ